MPNVLIVEDDALSFEVLKDQLQEQLSGWTVSGPAISIREAVKTIREQAPDLVFLDIGLKDGSGFEVLKQLGPIGFDVVVTTGNDQHALEAIKHSALDTWSSPSSPVN
ncbi:MAG TPA: response regulator [Bacteroidia bacterium]|nr:response regulator [Bacteroidia bacterium]